MKQWLRLIEDVLDQGTWQENRTGIRTLMIPGAMAQYDLEKGFPAVTTKSLAFKAMRGELLGFLKGFSSAKDFRDLGCNIWDQNANENKSWLDNPNRKGTDDLGRIYGVQWRDWNSSTGGNVDQITNCTRSLLQDPFSRRIILSAWRPDEMGQMSLPPCHVLYQFMVTQHDSKLHIAMYQRSCDLFLGVPFNVASTALLLSIMARMTGYGVGTVSHFMADLHIYENHIDQVKTVLSRIPKVPPRLHLGTPILGKTSTDEQIKDAWEHIEAAQIELIQYESHGPLKAPMAV